jgi:nicotinamide mononucleotide transporter
MDPLEFVAVVLGLANVGLLVRRSIWNYPFGMAMVALYAIIFFEARLYGESGLQIFFFVVQAYGWWLWARAGGMDHAVEVRWMGWPARLAWLGGIGVVAASLGSVMHLLTNAAMPFADASITAASIAAQFLLSFRRIENWILWIFIDVGSIALYWVRDLELTAALYVAFLLLSALGFREWIVASRRPQTA